MKGSTPKTTASGFRRFPSEDAPNEDILEYRRRHFNTRSVYRNRHMERMARNIYFWLGRQWIESVGGLIQTDRGFAFRDRAPEFDTYGMQLPRPVTNICAPAVEVEMAALGKRQWTPNIPATSKDPRVQAAARYAKELLLDRNRRMDWPTHREQHIFYMVVCGTGIIRSKFDESYFNLIPIGSPHAVRCTACETKLFSPEIGASEVERISGSREGIIQLGGDDIDEGLQVKLQNCPTCESPTPLQPHEVTEADINSIDPFGRSLGLNIPKGMPSLETVTPFDFYPENAGCSVDPLTMRVFGQRTLRSMDWVEEHYPDHVENIQPPSMSELLENHPVLGEWDIAGHYNAIMDSGILENHVLVDELYCKPTLTMPHGRSIVCIGEEICENTELMKVQKVGGQEVSVPKVFYGITRWKLRPGELWGHALLDDLVPINNRLNGLDAQVIEARARMGSPNLLVREDVSIGYPEFHNEYGSGKIMRYSLPPIYPDSAKPEVFGAIVMPAGTWQERDRILQDAPRVAGPAEVELGEAPRNITTTTGLQILGENAERRRAQREMALIATIEKVWSHTLDLEWCLRVEDDEYEVETEEGTWDRVQYNRLKLQGQTKVKIEKQAYVDKSIYQREATREAQADGLIIIDSPLARKRALELRGLPTDVNDDTNKQISSAERKWVEYMDDEIVPEIDETLDDPNIHFKVIGTRYLSDEGRKIETAAQWHSVLKHLHDWETDFEQAEMVDAQVTAFYGGRLDQQAGAEAFAQATITFQQQEAAQKEIEAAASQATTQGAGGVQVPPPPTPPPPPVFLPPSITERVLLIWAKRLQPQGMDHLVQSPFMRFRAVYEGYRLLAKRQAMEAMAPPPSAPGAPGTDPSAPQTPPEGGAQPPTQMMG